MNRPTFLKTSAANAAVGAGSPALAAIASNSLPSIPSLANQYAASRELTAT